MTADEIVRGMSLAQVRKLPATCDVTQAAMALGVSRASLYAAISEGSAPVRVIKVRKRLRVLTSSLIELLEGSRAASA